MPVPSQTEKIKSIDAEYLSGERFPYQEDISLLEDVDLLAATPGEDINWLEDIELLEEEGVRRCSTATRTGSSRSTFRSRGARERDRPQGADQAPAVGRLLRHPAEGAALQVPAARPGAVVDNPKTVGANWKPPVLEGWEPPAVN